MSHFPWLRFAGAAITFTGLGYMLMKATVPTEEELYNRMAPDIRKKVDAARALRLAREAEMKQQVAAQSILTQSSQFGLILTPKSSWQLTVILAHLVSLFSITVLLYHLAQNCIFVLVVDFSASNMVIRQS
ncbi:hypothetical protein DFH05DRAFT_284943 [Lentinula detonsa]|uniref:Uncharacterized protein n=1 Tax=Lentinula detonsa TaxID=2804962 RepID=A0A9W8NWA7_9AGAR|nr:hypothetical protein DFH05DRAFT_284943 [Lentinula detonsa]